MTASSAPPSDHAAAAREHAQARQGRVMLPVAVVLALALIIGAVPARRSRLGDDPPPVTVQIAVGSENLGFFQDPQVQAGFQSRHLSVQATGFGSLQMANPALLHKYDADFPSSEVTAELIQQELGPATPTIPIFASPLAIATYAPIAACLKRLHIASQDADGIWEFSVNAYHTAVEARERWAACGSSVSPVIGDVLLITTDPQCSNSGEQFAADASYAINGDSVVSGKAMAARMGTQIRPLFQEQGNMSTTTGDVFQHYLTDGMGTVPMGLIYESEFLGEEITHPGEMNQDMVLMYPDPTIVSNHTFIPEDSRGAKVGRLLNSDPALRQVAQDTYGFRVDNGPAFAREMARHQVFGKKIVVPQQFASAQPPTPQTLQDILDAIEPPPDC